MRLLRRALPLALAAGCVAGCAPRSGPEARSATPRIPGLHAPVRVVTDRFGIPHLHAADLEDLYAAWGWVTARDRLWQIEYNRRGARGELSDWLGNRKLREDGGAQLFELRARAERIWAHDRERAPVRLAITAYTRGINAYLAACRAGERPWPPEFTALGRQPPDWRPEDSVVLLLGQGVVLDLALPEIEEAHAIREHGTAWLPERERFENDFTFTTIPDTAAARLYGGGRPAAPDTGSRAVTLPDARALADARRRLAAFLSPGDPDRRASNAFAVGPGRSASGHALLANDPHLALGLPGPFHVVHVTVPGVLDAAGACVPGLPAIVSGRNRAAAWGITALSADMVDVYRDSLSADGRRVLDRGQWVPLRIAPFTMRYRLGPLAIPVPGQQRRYTRYGPVVVHDKKRGVALSVRWAGDDRDVTLGGVLGIEAAASADEVAARFRTLVTPGLNVIAADRAGRVIYQSVGALPRRGFDPGYGPLAGDGSRDWDHTVSPDQMPRWDPPRDGFVVNANNTPVGAAYPEPLPRFDWAHDRAARIAERLERDGSVDLGEMAAIQNDVRSRGAARFVPRLVRCADSVAATLSPGARAALDTLRAWDFLARRDRVAPTLYRAWWGALQRRSRLDNLPGLTAAALDGRAPEALRDSAGALERPAVAAARALEVGLDTLARKLGPDLSLWTWRRAHLALFPHRLGASAGFPPLLVAADGDNSTPCVGRSHLPWSTTFDHGPAFRHVVDLGVADSSLAVVTPGNAGDGRHRRDLALLWSWHQYVPLYLDWDRVLAVAESTTEILPAPAASAAP